MSKHIALKLEQRNREASAELESTNGILIDHIRSWDLLYELESITGVKYADITDRPTELSERLRVVLVQLMRKRDESN